MKLTYVAHVVEIALIVFLCIYAFVLAPSQSQPSLVTMSDFSRLANLATSVNSTEDVINDLTSLGCRLVNVSLQWSRMELVVVVSNYSDFRWIAYSTKLVFFATADGQAVYYFTPYQGLLIAFSPMLQSDIQGGYPTQYERLEFTSAYATKSGGTFTIHLQIKNTGSAAATIDISSLLYNGKPGTGYAAQPVATFNQTTLEPGQAATGTVTMTESAEWVSGMTVELMIHTVSGKDYPKVVTLP